MAYTFPKPDDPSHDDVRQWITFWASDYSTFSSKRTPEALISNHFNKISLPYPGIFNTQNQIEYSNMPTPQVKALEIGMFGSLQQSLLGTIEKTESFLRGGNVMTFDHMETVLQPGGRRTHRFEFNLIGKSSKSSLEAAKIANVFQTLMHPGFNTGSIYTQTHPALWVFTVADLDQSGAAAWSQDSGFLDGSGLPSVLTSVDINRAPIQNIPYVVSGVDGYGVPLAINIKLSFIELEPAFHGTGDGALFNRSQR
jgi:hypothetical protein